MKFKVYVRCMTFNQASYIEDAMNGFCMQKTNFPFLCVVIDDCSTDGEQSVIQKYLNENFEEQLRDENDDRIRIMSRHTSNTNCYFLVIYLKYNHYSIRKAKKTYFKEWTKNAQYCAVCEGDDFWTSPDKLQKQYDFMESHPDHSLCFHAANFLYSNGETKPYKRYDSDVTECDIRDMIRIGGGYSPTNSMFYNIEKYGQGYSQWIQNCPIGDLPMQLTLFSQGKVAYIAETMSCYRVNAVNSWSIKIKSDWKKRIKFQLQLIDLWKKYNIKTNKEYNKTIKKTINKHKVKIFKCIILHFFPFYSKLKKTIFNETMHM